MTAPAESGEVRLDPSQVRRWLVGLLAFAALAVVGLAVPIGQLGMRVLLLVVIFNVGVVRRV